MNQKRFLGFTLILAGILISLSKAVFTGAVVGVASSSAAGVIGAAITMIGIILVLAAEKENLEGRIIRTDRFAKSIRKYDPHPIEDAIKKIGTGGGKEKYLRHVDVYSIRVSKGSRILFEKRHGNIVLLEYVPSSEHS